MAVDDVRLKALQDAVAITKDELRPIITSLNGDNSWLWSFPRPPSEQVATGRMYYHIAFEPWLSGPTSVLSSWFLQISLSQPAAAACGADVEAIARQIEAAASSRVGLVDSKSTGVEGDDAEPPFVDAILMGFHYPDHLHEPTLRTFDRRIPVIASPEAEKKIVPLGHFDTVKVMADFAPQTSSWKSPSLHPGALPEWLTPLRLPGHAELNYCLTLIWSHERKGGETVHEAVFQSPHGTRLDAGPLQAFLDAQPPTEKLALFHGVKESTSAGYQDTYGAAGGLSLVRAIGGTKYWVISHSSSLQFAGLIFKLIWVRETPRTLQWALEEEASKSFGGLKAHLPKPNLIDVRNGDFFVLS